MGYRLDGVPSRKVVTKFKPVNAHVLGVLTFRVHVQKIYIPLQNPECFCRKKSCFNPHQTAGAPQNQFSGDG